MSDELSGIVERARIEIYKVENEDNQAERKIESIITRACEEAQLLQIAYCRSISDNQINALQDELRKQGMNYHVS